MKPFLAQIPNIIEFLGRDPFENETEDLVDNINEYQQLHGLTQKALTLQLEIDPNSISS